ncbi:hypothetical protein FQZ97_1161920 [compost metagenome]
MLRRPAVDLAHGGGTPEIFRIYPGIKAFFQGVEVGLFHSKLLFIPYRIGRGVGNLRVYQGQLGDELGIGSVDTRQVSIAEAQHLLNFDPGFAFGAVQ